MNCLKKVFTAALCVVSAMGAILIPASPVSAEKSYDGKIRKIPVYRKSLSENEKVDCMFFDDMPEIPYMAIDLYYKTFLDGEMTVKKQNDGKYLCTEKKNGETAVIDINADTLTSDQLVLFVSTPVRKPDGLGAAVGGPELITKTVSVKSDKTPEAVTVNYKKYNIDIREKDGSIYFPFASLSDLFGNTDMLTAVYRNDKIFFIAYYSDINGGEAINEKSEIPDWVKKGYRSEQQTEFAYNELCLCYDYFYGYPCTDNAFSDRMSQVGLDKALEELAPETRRLLRSRYSGEYLAGLFVLTGVELADGGHSGLEDIFNSEDIPDEVMDEFYKIYVNAIKRDNAYVEKNNNMYLTCSRLEELRQKAIGDEIYHKEGDTVLIRFDSFNVDYEGWQDYFSGKSDAMPEDTISIVYKDLQRAEADSSVKNVVFDVSTNTGGDSVALDWICGTIFGKSVCYEHIPAGNCTIAIESLSDKNLDGKIDEKDEEINYDRLNFGVLTSASSFSCGNLFPAMFRDKGCMVMGEQSSGGACCVLQKSTFDGVLYRMSGYCRAQFKDGNSIDDGIPVDVSLTDGSDYSSFYDLKKISSEMNAFYSGKKNTSEESDDSSQAASDTRISDGNNLQVIILWAVIGILAGISVVAVVITILVSRKRK